MLQQNEIYLDPLLDAIMKERAAEEGGVVLGEGERTSWLGGRGDTDPLGASSIAVLDADDHLQNERI